MLLKIVPLLLILLASCTTTRYQVFTMESNLAKDANEEFAYETDSMAVAYSFAATDGDIVMAVYNLYNKPLFINWKNSALIKNGRSTAMDAYIGTSVEIIPPGAFVIFSAEFDNRGLPHLKNNQNAIKYATQTLDGNYTIRRLSYSEKNSPMQLQTILQISHSENFENTGYLKHDFWLSEAVEFDGKYLLKSSIYQNSGPNQGKRLPNKYALKETVSNPAGQAVGWIVTIALFWLLLSVDA